MDLQGKKINFLGDGITVGCGVSHEELRFTDILKRRFRLADARSYGIVHIINPGTEPLHKIPAFL